MHFAAVSLNDDANAIQPKAIMPMTDVPKGFAPPIYGGRLEPLFWLMKCKDELVSVDGYLGHKCTFATIVPEGIGEKFDDRLL